MNNKRIPVYAVHWPTNPCFLDMGSLGDWEFLHGFIDSTGILHGTFENPYGKKRTLYSRGLIKDSCTPDSHVMWEDWCNNRGEIGLEYSDLNKLDWQSEKPV